MSKQAEEKEVKAERKAPKMPKVKWDDSNMKTTYSNAFNAFSSQEEVTLVFGTNQTLYTGQDEVTVELTNRIILSPHRAKALTMLLAGILKEYESRYGVLGSKG